MELPKRLQRISNERQRFIKRMGENLAYGGNLFGKGVYSEVIKELAPYITKPWDNQFDGTELEKMLRGLNNLERQLYEKRALVFMDDIRINLENLSKLNENYMTVLTKQESYDPLIKRVLFNYMGWDPDKDRFIPGGPFDSHARNLADIGFAKKEAIRAITTGVGWKRFEEDFAEELLGVDGKPGLIDKRVRQGIFDVYQDYDRTLITEMAKEDDVKHFLYQGGLMTTSRPFCIERNNKVYTHKEVESWRNLDFQGKTKNYDPFVHAGGYNCRHSYDPISEELYEEFKADQEANQEVNYLARQRLTEQAAKRYIFRQHGYKKGSTAHKSNVVAKIEDYTKLESETYGALMSLFLKDGLKMKINQTDNPRTSGISGDVGRAHFHPVEITLNLETKDTDRYKRTLAYAPRVFAHETGHAWHTIKNLVEQDAVYTDSLGNKHNGNIDDRVIEAMSMAKREMYEPIYGTVSRVTSKRRGRPPGSKGRPSQNIENAVIGYRLKKKYSQIHYNYINLAIAQETDDIVSLKRFLPMYGIDKEELKNASREKILSIASMVKEEYGTVVDVLQALSNDTEVGYGHGNNYDQRHKLQGTQPYYIQSSGAMRAMEFFAHASSMYYVGNKTASMLIPEIEKIMSEMAEDLIEREDLSKVHDEVEIRTQLYDKEYSKIKNNQDINPEGINYIFQDPKQHSKRNVLWKDKKACQDFINQLDLDVQGFTFSLDGFTYDQSRELCQIFYDITMSVGVNYLRNVIQDTKKAQKWQGTTHVRNPDRNLDLGFDAAWDKYGKNNNIDYRAYNIIGRAYSPDFLRIPDDEFEVDTLGKANDTLKKLGLGDVLEFRKGTTVEEANKWTREIYNFLIRSHNSDPKGDIRDLVDAIGEYIRGNNTNPAIFTQFAKKSKLRLELEELMTIAQSPGVDFEIQVEKLIKESFGELGIKVENTLFDPKLPMKDIRAKIEKFKFLLKNYEVGGAYSGQKEFDIVFIGGDGSSEMLVGQGVTVAIGRDQIKLVQLDLGGKPNKWLMKRGKKGEKPRAHVFASDNEDVEATRAFFSYLVPGAHLRTHKTAKDVVIVNTVKGRFPDNSYDLKQLTVGEFWDEMEKIRSGYQKHEQARRVLQDRLSRLELVLNNELPGIEEIRDEIKFETDMTLGKDAETDLQTFAEEGWINYKLGKETRFGDWVGSYIDLLFTKPGTPGFGSDYYRTTINNSEKELRERLERFGKYFKFLEDAISKLEAENSSNLLSKSIYGEPELPDLPGFL